MQVHGAVVFFFSVRYLQHPDHLWIFKAAFLKLGFNIKGPRPAKKEGSIIQNKTQQAKIGQVSWENRAKIATSYFPWDTRRGRRGPNTPPYYASDRTLWEKFISQHKPATQHRDGLHSDMPIPPPSLTHRIQCNLLGRSQNTRNYLLTQCLVFIKGCAAFFIFPM